MSHNFIYKIHAFILVTLALLPVLNAEQKERMPNLIILLADDLGYGELGCQGNKEIPTPYIDSIAKNGVRFTQGYVTAPNCSPSRAGLITGKLGTRFGHEFNPTGAKNEKPDFGLPLSQKTLADFLQNAGYINGLIGKWHLGGTAPYHPFRRGFDEFFGFTHEGHYFVPEPWEGTTTWLRRSVLPGGGKGRRTFGKVIYSTHMGYNEPDYDANNPIVRGSQPVQEKEYLTDAITRESTDFIERHADKPFFLFVSYNAVHSPLQATDKYMNKFKHIKDFQRRIFAAMLANLDDSVGEIMNKVKDNGLEKDTLVFFLSDNGGPTKELTSSNLPLRGEKGQMYEGGIRVPFLFQWVSKIPGGKTYDRPVLSTDIFATILSAANVPKPKDRWECYDLVPYLNDKYNEDPHEFLYWKQSHKAAFRVGDMKIVRQSPKKWELYDLANDPSESNNLINDEPERFKSLLEGWEKIDSRMVKHLFK